jgi:hypothetical protein
MVFHFPHYQGDTPHSAILRGNWKLLEFYETGEKFLFDLSADIGEQKNLAKEKPDLVADLTNCLHRYLESANAAMPRKNPDFDPAAEPRLKRGGKEGKGGRGGRGAGGKGMERRTEPPRTLEP